MFTISISEIEHEKLYHKIYKLLVIGWHMNNKLSVHLREFP